MSNASTPMGSARLGPATRARKPRLVSWGELLWDVFPERSLLGGSAANVAYHAALLGAESSLVSAVGSDSLGKQATEMLAARGVDVSGVTFDRKAATGKVHVTFVDGQPHFLIEEDAAWDQINPSPQTLMKMRSADVFCFSTLAQRAPLMQNRLFGFLREIRRESRIDPFGGKRTHALLCFLDLNLRPPYTQEAAILEALRCADIVKLNESEEDWLRSLCKQKDAVSWLLSEFSIRLVALTRGEHGASLFTPTVRVHASGIPQTGGDAVGAGDAFVAALGVALALGCSLPRALEQANRHAAWVAGKQGAMPGCHSPRCCVP